MLASARLFTGLIAVLTILSSTPAFSNPIYSWKDSNGVLTFSDDPTYAPKGAQVVVESDYPEPPQTDIDISRTEKMKLKDYLSREVTQGEFALQLIKELGFNRISTAKEATDLLTKLRISPPLGLWELNQSIDDRLMSRLRALALAAAESGRLGLSSDQVFLAFDTTTSMLNLPISENSTPRKETPNLSQVVETSPSLWTASLPQQSDPAPSAIPIAEDTWDMNYFYPLYVTVNTGLKVYNRDSLPSLQIGSRQNGSNGWLFSNNRPVTASPLISPLGRVIYPLSATKFTSNQ